MSRLPSDYSIGHPVRDEWEASEAEFDRAALQWERFGADATHEADAFRRANPVTMVEALMACAACGEPAVAVMETTPWPYQPTRVSVGWRADCGCFNHLWDGFPLRRDRDRRAAMAYDREMTTAAWAALEG